MTKITVLLLLIAIFTGIIAFNVHQYNFYKTKLETDKLLKTITSPSISNDSNLPYTATFLVFTNSLRRDFWPTIYHKRSEKVFIEGTTPYIITVNEKVTWQEFFDTMPAPFKLTSECIVTGTGQTLCNRDVHELKFYLNGTLTPHALDRVIEPNDKLLVTYGADPLTTINEQLSILNSLK